MKIELGKTYKTQSGRKARVICTDFKDPDGDLYLIVLIEDCGYEVAYRHALDGTHKYSKNTLVSEWED